MAGLSINNFWKLKTKLPFRFVADVYINGYNLTFSVKSFKLPKIELNTDGNVYLGNTNLIYPTANVATRKIDITFEETDDLQVIKAIHFLIQHSFSRQHYRIKIRLRQFDEHFQKTITDKSYICHLASYDEPSLKRDGSAGPIDINTSFIVDCEGTWEELQNVNTGNYTILADNDSNTQIKTLKIQNKSYEFDYSKYPMITNTAPADTSKSVNPPAKNGIGTGTKDFNVTDKEIQNALTKIQNDKTNPNGKNVTFEQLKKVQEYNSAKMAEAYNKLQAALNSAGISISVNAYNDEDHATGLGTQSGSHLLGQKVDLTFKDSNGNKMTAQNMTAEQKSKIEAAAKAAGLVANYEASNGSSSFWGDFSLANAMSIDSAGNTVTNQTMTSWTKGQVHRTDTNTNKNFG